MKFILWVPTLLVTVAAVGCANVPDNPPQGEDAYFERFSYSGRSVEGRPPAQDEFRNPVLSGYYPDPSVTRVGDDYYLVNSSFTNFPGIPVFHSRDLVNWSQVGNAVSRPTQFSFKGLRSSQGIYAPDISFRDGTYYLVTTCVGCGGNVVMTAKDPAGPWSDPKPLGFEGIDPSIFWDTDGKTYIVNNRAPDEKPRYDGHRAIWIQEFDPARLAMVGESTQLVNGGVDISTKPSWIEGPHVFRRGAYYYLIAAEGGTGDNHSEVVFRSTSVRGPYVPYERNPILSQRGLERDRPNPVTSAGHAKFVQTPQGDWWSVFLATRPYEKGLYNIGRETFLLPVRWKDDWPVILDSGKAIPLAAARPGVAAQSRPALPLSGDVDYIDEFTDPRLADQWIGVRVPARPFHRIENGKLVLSPAGRLGDLGDTPAFLARRQQHHWADIRTSVRYSPARDGDRAGLVAYQSDQSHLFFGLTRSGGQTVVALYTRAKSDADQLVASAPVPAGPVDLALEARGGKMSFKYAVGGTSHTLAPDVDVSFLSTGKAGGFTGTVIGPYVSRELSKMAR